MVSNEVIDTFKAKMHASAGAEATAKSLADVLDVQAERDEKAAKKQAFIALAIVMAMIGSAIAGFFEPWVRFVGYVFLPFLLEYVARSAASRGRAEAGRRTAATCRGNAKRNAELRERYMQDLAELMAGVSPRSLVRKHLDAWTQDADKRGPR